MGMVIEGILLQNQAVHQPGTTVYSPGPDLFLVYISYPAAGSGTANSPALTHSDAQLLSPES